MKFGVCRGLDDFSAMKAAKEAGADYFETGFGCLANYDDEKFNEGKAMLDSLGLPCYAANGFIPGDMPIVGEEVDYDTLVLIGAALNTFVVFNDVRGAAN